MEWYLKVLKNYVGFEGRARRTEYWMFALVSFIVSIVLLTLQLITNLTPLFTTLYSLFILLPTLAVTVRRLHDTGRSGWWYFISFIPLVGGIIIFVFTCLDSVEDNEYGPNPKGYS
ncbi:DUF805 domain-containing protein [Paenibacillus macquariensis]|uniref:Uncharacterized membrane protein YhaH, DUF805 family n=1 Tax=Paenibacillus macquariensis TaxID=948756 RepID=A0ABY1K3G7_9BACL|nr:DUF805 domain-containing protein [Paenibacillus macquariensis]MEC0090378.1 DUF805 domain-containing protein [Paenibacillus macquariensis]OAB39731.1 hypothetical protein PMSM_00975 [Paenibacillus macquariensis subsp. macquariensis]SIR20234.1 Uncharacterized membrane protein YhaH, DUF805 family [Paenibacillus macquariensis]